MASRKVSILEQSTRDDSVKSASNPGSAANAGENIRRNVVARSLAPTEHSDPNSSTKLLIRSYPEYSAIGVPVPANGQSLDPEENEQVGESRNTGNTTWLDWYKNTAVHFRNSGYIHTLQFVFSYIPVTAIIMGLTFKHECPQTSFLPLFVTIVGIVGFVLIGFWIAHSYCEHRGRTCSNFLKFSIRVSLALLLLIVAAETYIISHISPSFDESAPNYCSKTFYFYIIFKEVATAGALILAALLYFPGSSLHTCCQNCSAPSPAGAFFPMP